MKTKEQIKNLVIFIVVGIAFAISIGSLFVGVKNLKPKTEVEITQDSVNVLNTYLKFERNKLQRVLYMLDSVSKTGDTLIFTDKESKLYNITVTPRK